ncbi:MAG: hypothetical protein RR191_03645 [Cetobacterium sp.]|uniref:hypothetical protein n=1 Tax=unclassified Cetobacterium TaxID=2630983 RepID=UPI00163BAB72|nr:hypothetical protein [Cetobacterium sp. 2A]MBC2856004.1 hypothetical protein [Cetobacterium sp. 2A]
MELLLKILDEMSMAGILVSLTAYIVGIKFPDWDFKMGLKHRNILTHSPLVIFILMKLYEGEKSHTFRYFIMGFSLAMAIHFIFDLFPKGWGGGALLKVPIMGLSLSPKLTKSLFVIFIIGTLFIVVSYTEGVMEFIYLFCLGVFSLMKNLKKENKFFRPFIAYSLIFIIFGAIKYDSVSTYLQTGAKNATELGMKYYKTLKK